MAAKAPITLISAPPRHFRWLILAAAGLGLVSVLTLNAELYWKLAMVVVLAATAAWGLLQLSPPTRRTFTLHPGADRWQYQPGSSGERESQPLEFNHCAFNGRGWVVLCFHRPGVRLPTYAAFFLRHNQADDFRRLKAWLL